MGMWNITITGTGSHHNKMEMHDANRMAAKFVAELQAAGHEVRHAAMTFGGEDNIIDPTKYLQDRDALEGTTDG